MLQLLLVVWILFLVILIDNIKLKQLRHFLNLNKLSVYEQYNYVIICSNLHLTSDFKQFLVQYPQVQIQFFKKSKKSARFSYTPLIMEKSTYHIRGVEATVASIANDVNSKAEKELVESTNINAIAQAPCAVIKDGKGGNKEITQDEFVSTDWDLSDSKSSRQ